jgi:hypothetical protein
VAGRQQHAWATTFTKPATGFYPITDLSWVGDRTVGFALTNRPQVSEEVRTLTIDAAEADPDLMGASRVVWSQDVPPPPGGTSNAAGTPHACDTPFLTSNGQAVVCATLTYSARDKRQLATWLAYPVATPARPHVIGSVADPTDGPRANPTVKWTNSSGTEVIGTWNGKFEGVIGGATVRPFPLVLDPLVAW